MINDYAVAEWQGLFDDPIPDNSALNRLVNVSCQIIIEGTSYREPLSPDRKRGDVDWYGGRRDKIIQPGGS